VSFIKAAVYKFCHFKYIIFAHNNLKISYILWYLLRTPLSCSVLVQLNVAMYGAGTRKSKWPAFILVSQKKKETGYISLLIRVDKKYVGDRIM
jgi:hypothetical protein